MFILKFMYNVSQFAKIWTQVQANSTRHATILLKVTTLLIVDPVPEVGHAPGLCVEEVDQVPGHVHQGHGI